MAYDAHPMLQVWVEMTGELNDATEYALNTYRQDRLPGAPSLAKIRTTWRPIPDALDGIEATVGELGEAIATIAANPDLTADARDRRIVTLGDVAWTSIKTTAADIETRTQTILDLAREAVYPVRPTPIDQLQEAQLAALKVDTKMLLDPLGTEQAVTNQIKVLLARALGAHDELAAWLLASSTWPSDYLTSRGFDIYLPALAAEIDEVIAAATPDAEAVLALHRALSDPQTGLPGVAVLLGTVLQQVFDLVNQWRPTNTEPTPPSRNLRPTATDPTLGRTQPPPVARTENTMSRLSF